MACFTFRGETREGETCACSSVLPPSSPSPSAPPSLLQPPRQRVTSSLVRIYLNKCACSIKIGTHNCAHSPTSSSLPSLPYLRHRPEKEHHPPGKSRAIHPTPPHQPGPAQQHSLPSCPSSPHPCRGSQTLPLSRPDPPSPGPRNPGPAPL